MADLESVEIQRLRLEDSIKQLQKAVQHWQTWDAEYEGLKEEVEAVKEDEATQIEDLQRIHDDFDGELLVGKEIDDVIGATGTRSKAQIINVLDRRIDYVTKNIEQLQRQLAAVESQYVLIDTTSQGDVAAADSQPVTEILEELDDNDNVVSYQLKKGNETAPYIDAALQKVGVNVRKGASNSENSAPVSPQPSTTQAQTKTEPNLPVTQHQHIPKKAVAFTEDTKPGETQLEPPISRNAQRVEQIMKTAKEQEHFIGQEPVIPEDEDEDDAALRREMLKYSMEEVGAVVAELELEEGDVTDDDDVDYDELSDDDEDKYGRSKSRIVTDDYRQRMLELEQRLGIKSRFTEAHNGRQDVDEKSDDDDNDNERIGRIVVSQSSPNSTSATKPEPQKSSIKDRSSIGDAGSKGVRFAENLDVAPNETTKTEVEESKTALDPLSDVVERSASAKVNEPVVPRKPSRFKKAKQASTPDGAVPKGPLQVPAKFLDQNVQEAPSGPEGTTIADTLVERDSVSNPLAPDEMVDVTDYHEVASEYQRMRKRFIQRQGGFLKEEESAIQPLDESEGGPERMSRFKAARLSRQ